VNNPLFVWLTLLQMWRASAVPPGTRAGEDIEMKSPARLNKRPQAVVRDLSGRRGLGYSPSSARQR
jgi:hypothetical protein